MNKQTPEFRCWTNNPKSYRNHIMVYPGDGIVKEFFFDGREWDSSSYGHLMEWTKSFDANGKKIYEGDIVLWHSEDHFEGGYSYKKMVVGWNQRCMQFRLYEFPNQVNKSAGEQFWAEDVRVIGHIFDYENEECRYHLDKSVKSLAKQSDTKP